MKKFLFSMICTLLPILASAQVQNEELTPYAVLSDDHTVLTFFYDNDKESKGGMGMDIGPFTSADERGWNEYCENIEQVVFVEAFAGCEAITSTKFWFYGFTNLAVINGLENLKTNNVTDMASMFDGCSSLTSLDLGGFETSQVTDMTYIFAGCSGLTSLDVNGFNTSNTKSMAGMFRDCSGLTSLDISAFDTSEATEMSEMFSGCSGLTSLDLGDNFNTSNVTTMNSMFSGCSNLSNLDVSGFETPEVTNMGAMFNNCSMLTSLDLGDNFNTSNVTNMEAMFSGCSNLESLDVSNFNTANVTAMGSMFGGCSKLTTLDLSGFDTSNATDLGHMFALCSSLTSLDVTGFNTSNATNMVCMFEGCSGLTSLDVSNFDTSNATNLSSMFILCSGLTSLDVSGFNTSNATDLCSMFAGCSGLTSLDVSGSFDTSNATNLSAMFEDCSSLTNLDLSGFNTANATNLSSMFIRCSGLTSLDVSNFNTANVTDMGNMFDGCSKLVSLDVSGLNTENVTNMGYMFSDCLKLTSPLDVSEFNTANVVRMDYMFNHCESLTALDVSNFNTANVTTMGSMFNYCSNLESLDVSNFNTEKVTYMAWMFADCSNLTSLDVSNFNTTNVTDMGAMFTSCSGLTELDLSNFDTSNTTTLELFFNKCSGLTSLDLSNFNTANVKNMDSMFSQCSGLETISTGNEWSTENIESGAGMFIGCTALVGGAGTTYDENHVDYAYAHIDGGSSNPGYLSGAGQAVPYAVLNEDNSVLTFYYDDQKAKQNGMSVGPFTESSQKGWYYQSEFIEQVIFDESFANCTTITSTSWWFNACTSLTTITGLENLKTDNVTNMSCMFYECYELTSLDLNGFNTSMVTDMGGMFYGCSGLTSLDVSGFNTSNVTMMANMFGGCSGLTSLNVSEFDTSKATNMSFMFSYCHGLTSLDLSGFNTANVTLMTHMFLDCISLKTIYVGEGWSTEKILSEEDGTGMFNGCTKLIGGAGTVFDNSHTDYTFAHIDGGLTNPGYFTDKEPYAVLSENNTVLTFYYDNQKVTRSGMSIGLFTAADEREWDEQCENIVKVEFDGSFANCTTITSTSYWFYGFKNLTNIKDLENLKTDNVEDMSYMFFWCESLTSLDVSNFNTSKVTDMGALFWRCSSLTNLDVSGFDTSNATNMSEMFFDCSSLISLDVSGFDTSNATNIEGIFWNCESLTSLDVSGFDTSKATDMSSMFYGCQSLTSLDVSGFDTSNAITLDYMFADCESLTNLDVSGFDTSKATRMASMFGGYWGCSNLVNLDLSNFNTANVTDMYEMFRNCSSLVSLDLSSFNTANVNNMHQMFLSCSSLTTIYVGEGWTTENVTTSEMFKHCPDLVGGRGTTYDANHIGIEYAHIDGGTSNPGYLTDINGPLPYAVLSENNTILTFYYDDQKATRGGMDVGPFEQWGGQGTKSGWSDVNEQITTVVFDESFANCTTLTSTAYWFYGCENLTTIKNISNLKTDNVTDINSMFGDCHSLKSIDFSSLNLSNVTNMHQVFEDCRALESIDFSGVNTENVTNMGDLFLNCKSLKTIDISSFNTKNVTKMTSMFYKCDVLTTIYVGDGWTTKKVTESAQMFEKSPNLVGGRGTTYDENHIGIEYAHIDGGTSNPGYLTDINGASEETWAKLQSRIEYGTDVLAKAKEISSVDQALIEKLDEALQNANQMYKIHEASEDEVLHMIEVLNERINDVEEAMNQPASEETWEELKATIEYGTDVLAKAKEISTIDQWLIEELDMTLDSGNQMYKIHEASEEEVLNMIDELNWRIKEVEEAMNQPASDEAWAELNKAVETGEKLQTEAKGVSTVEPWALEELENMTAKGSEMYKVHTAGEEEVRHMTEELNQIINEVEEMMRKQPQGEASFDGLTAYVSGNATLDDAFKSVGGRSEAAKTIAAIVWNADNALTADMLSGIDNPNLLVYVTEASKAPSGVQNVIIDGVASEIVLTDATGNNNFYCPQSFTAKSISYSRDFSQTTEIDVCRGWETIALPFDVQSITHESHGTLVPFGGSDNGYPFWLRQLSTNGLARATKIEANRPYLICMPNNIIYPPEYNQNGTVTFSSSNVTVPVTSARSSTSAGVTLHATFQQVTKSSSVYALNVGETRGEYPEGSVFEQNYRDIRPFQAYTTHSAGTRSFITLESIGGNDDATGIEELRIKNSEFGDAEGVWYSLDGRRLDAKPTKKGVYVKDGRKIVIK